MSIIQQFYQLPEDIQREVLDFMSFVAQKNGIELPESDGEDGKSRWLKNVKRHVNTAEQVSDSVVKLRKEEKW